MPDALQKSYIHSHNLKCKNVIINSKTVSLINPQLEKSVNNDHHPGMDQKRPKTTIITLNFVKNHFNFVKTEF